MRRDVILANQDAFDYWLSGGKICYKPQNDKIWMTSSNIIDWSDITGLYIQDDEYVEFRKAQAEGKTIQCNIIEGQSEQEWIINHNNQWKDSYQFTYHPSKYRIKPDEPKFPCYYKEKSSGIIVYFEERGNTNCYNLSQVLGVVVEGINQAQKTTGFIWRCWDTFSNPERWERLEDYTQEPIYKVGDWVRLLKSNEVMKVSRYISNTELFLELKSFNSTKSCHIASNCHNTIMDIKPWQPQEDEWCWFWNKNTEIPCLAQFQRMWGTGQDYFDTKENGVYNSCEPFIGELPTNVKDHK